LLRPGGSLCFTVPIIVSRYTRSRAAPQGPYGKPSTASVAQTEFGADVWKFVVMAGFRSLMIQTVSFPNVTAISAQK
jgi:hypothetical protein